MTDIKRGEPVIYQPAGEATAQAGSPRCSAFECVASYLDRK